MSIPNLTTTPPSAQQSFQRSINRSETSVLKVTAVALGTLISLYTFAIYGPIPGLIVTGLVGAVLSELFKENTNSGAASPGIFVRGGISQQPAPCVIIQNTTIERQPVRSFNYTPTYSCPSIRKEQPVPSYPSSIPAPSRTTQSVHVGVGTQQLSQETPAPGSRIQVGSAKRKEQQVPSYPSSIPAPSRTTQSVHVGVGTQQLSQETPAPGSRIQVGSAKRR